MEAARSKGPFVGTSNVHMSIINQTKAIGTQAHEWFSFMAAVYGPKIANTIGMEKWIEVYKGKLGIALTDTFTTDVFLRSFDSKYARIFDGTRQDSGDPVAYIPLLVDHYRSLGIDPLSKKIVFSDGINKMETIHNIMYACKEKIIPTFGIGTWLTNDFEGITPLNMVIKLHSVKHGNDWIPAIKLSDSPTKNTGDPDEILAYKKVFNI